ncbi:polycystic kidney disease 2-like 2 protein isoform X2 [Zeugodacus cucurbitae]|uniref:polycystic kidney disease 2-like 2 protein isoform X2 n=1 Tax=Zeugodacus cucurbitae TaxID=28588 RepID=UPI0023D8F8F0|nr:polycystic kidney disease 2-like 2 protein isoform X2 [Zeugodacus cucurbitae]
METTASQNGFSKATKKSHRISYENEDATRSALIEFCIYICFLIVTLLVASSSRNMSMYFFNKGIENLFLTREVNTSAHESSVKFAHLATTADMWAFLETKFIMDLHGEDNRGGTNEEGNSERKRRSTEDKLIFLEQNLVLGPPRLRQLRVRENTCDVHNVFGRYFSKCYADYSGSDEDTSDIYKGTRYNTLSALNADSIWGQVTTYRSGGYVRSLSYHFNENNQILSDLKSRKWLDRASRLIMVEFTLYNANKDLVNNIKFIGELPSTGGVVTTFSIESVKLRSVFWRDGIAIFVIGIIFYLFIFYFTIIEILEVIRIGCTNYLAYCTLIYNIWHPFYVSALYKRFEKNPNDYLQLDKLCFWNLTYRAVFAICAFLVCMKILKFISFNKTMRQFNATVSTCFRDLLGFGVMFGIVFLAYAQLGLLLFGNVHHDFRNFKESLLTMIRMILGDFDYEGIEAANRVLGPIFFLTYILLVFFILLNMFLAIINDTYSSVKSDIRGGRNYLTTYLRKLLNKYCPKCCRCSAPKDEELGPAKEGTPSRDASPQSKRSVGKDKVVDYFEPVGRQQTQAQSTDPAAISRLTARVAALEDVIEQLIADVDRTMRKVLPRRRQRQNDTQDSPSQQAVR